MEPLEISENSLLQQAEICFWNVEKVMIVTDKIVSHWLKKNEMASVFSQTDKKCDLISLSLGKLIFY